MQKIEQLTTDFSAFKGKTIASMRCWIDGMPVPFKGDWNCSGEILLIFEVIFTTGEKVYTIS